MERYVGLILAFLFSTSALAALPAGVPVKTYGNLDASPAGITVPISDTTYFELYMFNLTLTADGTYHFYQNGGAYQVTAGKTAYCDSANYLGTAASIEFQFFSATNNFTDGGVSGSLTLPKYQCGAAAAYCMMTSTTANSPHVEGLSYTFAASTYPGVQAQSSAQRYQVHLICREQ